MFWKKALCVSCLTAIAPVTYAFSPYFNDPYLGVEVIQTNQHYKAGKGKDVYKKNPQDYSVFGGFKFWRFLGLEAGFEWQPKRNKSGTLGAGESLPGGATLTGSETAGFSSNIRGVHPYVGLFAELDQTYCWIGKIKYQALVAASFSYVKANDTLESIDGVAEANPTQQTYSQHRIVPLVKLSAGHNFTQRFGLRISVDYRNTNEFTILKDTWGIGLGATYSI
jgi:hypothetical protein